MTQNDNFNPFYSHKKNWTDFGKKLNLHDAISIVQTCSSRGNLESSIMQENFIFNLERKKRGFVRMPKTILGKKNPLTQQLT